MGFQAAQLHSLQWANWQRGGGRGSKPKPITRPIDAAVEIKTKDELYAKKQEFDDEIARRRAARDARSRAS